MLSFVKFGIALALGLGLASLAMTPSNAQTADKPPSECDNPAVGASAEGRGTDVAEAPTAGVEGCAITPDPSMQTDPTAPGGTDIPEAGRATPAEPHTEN